MIINKNVNNNNLIILKELIYNSCFIYFFILKEMPIMMDKILIYIRLFLFSLIILSPRLIIAINIGYVNEVPISTIKKDYLI